jgi:alkaline phosphatase D
VAGTLSRRGFIGGALATGALAACSGGGSTAATTTTTTLPTPRLAGYPFTLGVASGDPTDEAVVLWTRLAPDALTPGGGMPTQDVPVRWEVATDERFADLVADGTAVASPAAAHTVHVDAAGLEPGREYVYRFLVGDDESPVGRAVTMPSAGDSPDRFVIGHVSCARWGEGHYAAYRDLAGSDCDLVVCCGDYIYERGAATAAEGAIRRGQITAVSLDDYRYLYALHRSDEHLRDAHEAAPWVVVWDDHETSNNYVGDTPDPDSESRNRQQLLRRRAAAYQAWWEHMPVRLDPPTGPDLQIYRAVDVGALARVHLVDTRQYRTPLDCPDTVSSIGRRCATSFDPLTSVLGEAQEAWLAEGLADGDRAWDVVANQIVLHQWRFGPGDDAIFNLDQWDGYPEARTRMTDALARAAGDVVVLTGDVHSTWVADVQVDFDDPSSARVGTELIAPGVTSSGEELAAIIDPVREFSPHIRYADAPHRGWLRHEVTAEAWTTEIRHVDDHRDASSSVRTAGTWVVERGQAAAEA